MITVGIIAKNEEKYIEDCIRSVLCFADEIIVIDNGSNDETASISKKFGCRVITNHSENESVLRNNFLEESRGEWIVTIDADERASSNFGTYLRAAISENRPSVLAYQVPINHYFGAGKWACFPVIRVIKKNPMIRYNDGNIHPSVYPSIQALKSDTALIGAQIHHIDALIKNRSPKKRQDYINKMENLIKCKDINMYRLSNYLGVEYTVLGKYEQAEYYYRLTEKNLGTPYNNFAIINICMNYMMQRKYNKVKDEIAKLVGDEFLSLEQLNIDDTLIQKMKAKSDLDDDYLQRLAIMMAEIQYSNGNLNESKKWCKLGIYIWPFASHHYINLASLEESESKKNELIQLAIINNSYLLKEIIYGQGFYPNIYSHQTALLSSTDTLLSNFHEKFILTKNTEE